MSGIVAVVRSSNGPIDRTLIESLTAALAVRGPDGQQTWCDGIAALGHARLQIGVTLDLQPLTLDGDVWIVADARIDDRRTVARALGIPSSTTASDAELILRAYARWGDACVDYLIGDFAFAIWNRSARRLFCARDQLGVRPLYYADTGGWLLVSSSVASLRRHAAVSERLNDLAVADFLLFGHNADLSTTTFRDIRAVPPAHTLSWSPNQGCRVQRYWELPIDEPTYRSDQGCAAELRNLLDTAIVDRLRGGRTGVMFSGGLDSVTVAARARRCGATHDEDAVKAFSFTHASTFPDGERQYASTAATHLRIRCDFYEADTSDGWAWLNSRCTPEPLCQTIDPRAQARCFQDMAAHSRIAFSGEGPDNALVFEWRRYLGYLWKRRELRRMGSDAVSFLRHHRRVPLWSTMTRYGVNSEDDDGSPIPPWMSADLVQRLRLEDRWHDVLRPADSHHPVRPAAWFSLQIPLWQAMHNECDPCYTGVPLEFSHPFLDVRVLRFLLQVPVIPWCRNKHLLRYAFRNDLPPAVRLRSKTPLPESFDLATIRRNGVPPLAHSSRLGAYVSADTRGVVAVHDARSAAGALRLATFSHWLARLDSPHVASRVG